MINFDYFSFFVTILFKKLEFFKLKKKPKVNKIK